MHRKPAPNGKVKTENEQYYFEERSEEWQCSEKGDEFQDRLYALEEFKDALDNAVCNINEVMEE